MTFALLIHSQTIVRGRLAAVLAAGIERELVTVERYPARRTGDDVTKHRLAPGVRVEICAGGART